VIGLPRPNPLRRLMGESNLARRIAYERKRRGWSAENLAQRMGEAGCPLDQSAIWKIENGDPPRRITYDEALGFAVVFGLSLDELSTSLELALAREAQRLFDEYDRARRAWAETQERLVTFLTDHPHVRDVIEENFAADPVIATVVERAGRAGLASNAQGKKKVRRSTAAS
jgi:transcriptional regulator with XRE-family HTH domain